MTFCSIRLSNTGDDPSGGEARGSPNQGLPQKVRVADLASLPVGQGKVWFMMTRSPICGRGEFTRKVLGSRAGESDAIAFLKKN